eukprot:CAMPEP_0197246794 /NCGR_PEP_ID=MMETSP1429-20130617/22909_1 /TAXON_ID=49237 /ORGANISM="Chaetoceros  sp., Strain UNC1202" /LENGTH=101 /DNA_ID=CAMNT_0042707543 /DNA_START=143 /DNA_END=448 /DNA_ORIENTATION=+
MGNNASAAKGALAVANAKSQATSVMNSITGDDKKKKKIAENPETKREMNRRHKEREMEFKRKKLEREKKKASLTQKWNENQAKGGGGSSGGKDMKKWSFKS